MNCIDLEVNIVLITSNILSNSITIKFVTPKNHPLHPEQGMVFGEK